MDSLLANLRAQLDEAHTQASVITQRAADENRDLNDAEQHNFDALKLQIEGLQPRITNLVETQQSYDASAGAIASVTREGERSLIRAENRDFMANTYRSAGDWIVDYLTSKAPAGTSISHEQRAAAHNRIERAVANQLLADNPGIVPDPIMGPVINYQDSRRPVWNSFTQRTITNGPLFYRPRVTQHTQVGKQSAEKTELASRKMLIERVSVTVDTYGGVVDVSLQDQQWSDPSIMQALIDDLRAQYVIQTESVAATLLNTTADANTTTTVTPASAAKLVQAIYDASAVVFAGIGLLPTHLAMSVDMWAKVGGMSDSAGRPIFATVGAQNAPGTSSATSFNTSVLGLTPIVSSGLPSGTIIVYRADALEAWEQVVGVLQVTEPRLLGTELAYAGFATALSLHAKSAATVVLTP